MEFLQYELTSNLLCLGETVKSDILKPCCKTIRYSSITGAIRKIFGNEDIHAVGYLEDNEDYNQINILIHSPRDRNVNSSKFPLQVEFLSNVKGKVYIPVTNNLTKLPDEFEIRMGALLSKGFGLCKLVFQKIISEKDEESEIIYNPVPEKYVLNVRIPEKQSSMFNIKSVVIPVYGYLFQPIGIESGIYVRSLFEGSIVQGPVFLLKKEV